MDLEEYLPVFGTRLKVRACIILGERERTLTDILERYNDKYRETKNRETMYRALEGMVQDEVVGKRYDTRTKRFYYSLKIKRVTLDFVSNKIHEN